MTEPPSSIAYDTHRHPATNEWRLLRLIAMLWSAFVLYRHGTYWSGQMLDNEVRSAAYRSAGAMFKLVGPDFPFAGVEATAEAVLLLMTLLIAIRAQSETPRAARALRILGIGFMALSLSDFFLNTDLVVQNGEGIFRGALRLSWQLVSKLQLFVVPIAMAIGPRGRLRSE